MAGANNDTGRNVVDGGIACSFQRTTTTYCCVVALVMNHDLSCTHHNMILIVEASAP